MKKWRIKFWVNGHEYLCDFFVWAKRVRKINNNSFKADGVLFEYEETIESIKEDDNSR